MIARHGKKHHSANNSQTFNFSQASLWENLCLRTAHKFSNCFYAHDFVILKEVYE